MLLEDVKKLPVMERLCYFIRERQQVYLKRKAGTRKPWTDDIIIQTCYFCNIRREQDKTTEWVDKHIREPLANRPEVAFAVLAFRWFNYIPTGEVLLQNDGAVPSTDKILKSVLCKWDAAKIKKLLANQKQIFTGAFTISPSGSTKPKLDRVIDDYIQPVWEHRKVLYSMAECSYLWSAFNVLSRFPGMAGGGFMAAQVIADLRYTYMLDEAKDAKTWCCLGPGSTRGLNRLLGRPVDSPRPSDWQDQMVTVQDILNEKLRLVPKLHMQDCQNCLCEFSKYERVLWAQGKSKRKYNGTL